MYCSLSTHRLHLFAFYKIFKSPSIIKPTHQSVLHKGLIQVSQRPWQHNSLFSYTVKGEVMPEDYYWCGLWPSLIITQALAFCCSFRWLQHKQWHQTWCEEWKDTMRLIFSFYVLIIKTNRKYEPDELFLYVIHLVSFTVLHRSVFVCFFPSVFMCCSYSHSETLVVGLNVGTCGALYA